MPEISPLTQEEHFTEISKSFHQLADLVQDNPQAYKLCFAINTHFVAFADAARLLYRAKPKELVEL